VLAAARNMKAPSRRLDASDCRGCADAEALGIFRVHFDGVVPALAQDLAAETFATAFSSRASYDLARDDAAPWLFGIAANIASRHWRDESFRSAAYERFAGELGDAAESGLESTVAEIDERTAAALRLLSDEQREALCLMAWGELSYEEIASALDVPVGTVRSRISRGRVAFREAIGALTHDQISTEGARR